MILYSFSSIEVSGCDSQSINTSPWRPWKPPPLGRVIPQTQPAVRTAPPHQLQKPKGAAKSVWFIEVRSLWKILNKKNFSPMQLELWVDTVVGLWVDAQVHFLSHSTKEILICFSFWWRAGDDVFINRHNEYPLFDQQEIHLGNNQIRRITSEHLQHLESVSVLDIRDNKISELPDEITCLSGLQRLDLTNNDLTG